MRRPFRPPALAALLLFVLAALPAAQEFKLPNADGSLKFAVIGDMGTGDREQFEVGAQMDAFRQVFDFKLVLMTGDNLYGPERPSDYRRKFEEPYQALLDGGVKFYASLGNHDEREQRLYKQFNMDGKLYYSFKAPDQDVRFFALESTYFDEAQQQWLEKELAGSKEKWKIAYFHHPLYSSGERHGSNIPLRRQLEPLFVKYGVSVVFNGHEHFYERLKPQQGIHYFITGAGGKLREGNIDRGSGIFAAGFDRDQSFMLCEIQDDVMYFQSISRRGESVDSGFVVRRGARTEDLPELLRDVEAENPAAATVPKIDAPETPAPGADLTDDDGPSTSTVAKILGAAAAVLLLVFLI